MRETDYDNGRAEGRPDGRRYEWDDDTALSIAVVKAVAAASGRDPTDIEPLYQYVDPDALDALFEQPDRGRAPNGTISFPVEDYFVVVRSDGEVVVYPPE